MDPRIYPQGKVLLDVKDAITSPTLTDKIEVIRGDSTRKYITLSDFLQGLDEAKFAQNAYTASGAIDSKDNFVVINSATPATAIELTIAAPAAGRLMVITQQDEGTAGNKVTLTAGTFDGSKAQLVFNAKDETVVLFGVSAARFVIVENIGSVALATPA